MRRPPSHTALGAAAWPLAAQEGDRVRRISVLTAGDENDPVGKTVVSAFTQALAGIVPWTKSCLLLCAVEATTSPAVSVGGPRVSDHRDLFERAARAAELPAGTTIYSLRHSSIARALLRRVPIKLVADWHDTSVAMIERHYGRFFRATATISSAPRSSTLRPQS